MKNKVCFINPYFGLFPKHFNYWLECCRRNPDYTWIIITDSNENYDYPTNVRIIKTYLSELKKRIEKLVGFTVCLDKPYKLCDVRPLFGDLFSKEIEEYTHWGYCDFDLIFGNLNHFFSDDILERYDKVSAMGHMTVLKKTESIVNLYKTCNYRKVLQDNRNRTFDELMFSPNINELIVDHNLKLKKTVEYSDIGATNYNFHLFKYISGKKTTKEDYKPTIFWYTNGILYKAYLNNEKVLMEEIAYVHFSRRAIEAPKEIYNRFAIIPNEIISCNEVTSTLIKENSKNRTAYCLKRVYKRVEKAVRLRIGV